MDSKPSFHNNWLTEHYPLHNISSNLIIIYGLNYILTTYLCSNTLKHVGMLPIEIENMLALYYISFQVNINIHSKLE